LIAIVLSYRYCTIAVATGFFLLQHLQYFNNNAASKTKEIRVYHDHPNIIMITVVCRLLIFKTVLMFAMWLEFWSHAPFFEGPMGANATFRDTFEQ
jgi:hypothetical protein